MFVNMKKIVPEESCFCKETFHSNNFIIAKNKQIS